MTHGAPVQRYAAVELGTQPLEELLALDLDIATLDQQNGQARIIADDDGLAALEEAGFSPRVLIDDLTDFYAKRLEAPLTPLSAGSYGAWLNPQFSQGGMGGYYTLAQIESVLDQMTAAYPNLITARQSIGSSLQGRSQWMVKISDNPGSDENEPEVRFDALHHSREPQGMQTTLWFMLFLLEEYGSDPLATYLVNEREIYFVPCVNPDGYEYNRSIAPNGGGLWRKNRRNNGGGSFGVDLNRNYPYRWGFDNFGSSPDPNSEVYRGPSAASEPEVSNMVSFISGRQFRTALSVHTFSDLWLSPWGYDELYPANWPQYDEVGTLATEFNGHPHGPASIILYEANGVTVDYDHGQHGTLSWTPEIGSSTDGFWPPQSRIVPLARENLEAFQRTALAGGPWVRMQDVTSTDVGDGDGSFEAGEGVEFVVDLRNSGSVASGSVDLNLSTSSSAVTITTADTSTAAISAFSNGQNATPLALTVNGGTPSGTGVDLILTVTYGGFSQDFPFEIVIGQQITLAAFDFEAGSDEGWSVGAPNNASTGNWVRVNPRGTNAQTEDDHTPNPGVLCWVTGQGSVGGSDGENDVDGGRTTLLSPIFDLDGRIAPRIRYWRWYSNDVGSAPNEDTLAIDLSNNGGSSWSSVEVIGPDGPQTSGGWFEHVFEVESIPAAHQPDAPARDRLRPRVGLDRRSRFGRRDGDLLRGRRLPADDQLLHLLGQLRRSRLGHLLHRFDPDLGQRLRLENRRQPGQPVRRLLHGREPGRPALRQRPPLRQRQRHALPAGPGQRRGHGDIRHRRHHAPGAGQDRGRFHLAVAVLVPRPDGWGSELQHFGRTDGDVLSLSFLLPIDAGRSSSRGDFPPSRYGAP